ncbi:hypothetical protein ABZ135_12945 [Streptomyces sp. NPDC006339]
MPDGLCGGPDDLLDRLHILKRLVEGEAQQAGIVLAPVESG